MGPWLKNWYCLYFNKLFPCFCFRNGIYPLTSFALPKPPRSEKEQESFQEPNDDVKKVQNPAQNQQKIPPETRKIIHAQCCFLAREDEQPGNHVSVHMSRFFCQIWPTIRRFSLSVKFKVCLQAKICRCESVVRISWICDSQLGAIPVREFSSIPANLWHFIQPY